VATLFSNVLQLYLIALRLYTVKHCSALFALANTYRNTATLPVGTFYSTIFKLPLRGKRRV